jgi:hypothetical protein
MVFGFDFVLGFGVCSASSGSRRPEGLGLCVVLGCQKAYGPDCGQPEKREIAEEAACACKKL